MLIVNADLEGRRVDLRFDQQINEIASGLTPRSGERILDAKRGRCCRACTITICISCDSCLGQPVDCGDTQIVDAQGLQRVLQQHPGDGWLRGVNYDESIAGELLRWQLDRLIDQRLVRIQHQRQGMDVKFSRCRSVSNCKPMPASPVWKWMQRRGHRSIISD